MKQLTMCCPRYFYYNYLKYYSSMLWRLTFPMKQKKTRSLWFTRFEFHICEKCSSIFLVSGLASCKKQEEEGVECVKAYTMDSLGLFLLISYIPIFYYLNKNLNSMDTYIIHFCSCYPAKTNVYVLVYFPKETFSTYLSLTLLPVFYS